MTQAYFKVDRSTARGPNIRDLPLSGTVAELWAERRNLRFELRRAQALRNAAIARMPAWAAPGPKSIDARGRRVGEVVHWPELAEFQLPRAGIFRLVRPSPYELRRHYVNGLVGPKGLPLYLAALKKLARRRRAQRVEEDRAGLFEMEAALREVENRVDTVSQTITDHEEHSFDAVAAKILIHAQFTNDDDSPADFALEHVLPALKATRPGLTGAIAVDVAEVFAKPKSPICELKFHAF